MRLFLLQQRSINHYPCSAELRWTWVDYVLNFIISCLNIMSLPGLIGNNYKDFYSGRNTYNIFSYSRIVENSKVPI